MAFIIHVLTLVNGTQLPHRVPYPASRYFHRISKTTLFESLVRVFVLLQSTLLFMLTMLFLVPIFQIKITQANKA